MYKIANTIHRHLTDTNSSHVYETDGILAGVVCNSPELSTILVLFLHYFFDSPFHFRVVFRSFLPTAASVDNVFIVYCLMIMSGKDTPKQLTVEQF